MHTFETPGPTTLVVRTGAGHVTVTRRGHRRAPPSSSPPLNAAGEEAVAEARVEQQRDSVVVDIPRHRGGLFRPRPLGRRSRSPAPPAASLEVKAESADIARHRQLRRGRRDHRLRRRRTSRRSPAPPSSSPAPARSPPGTVGKAAAGHHRLRRRQRRPAAVATATVTVGSGDISIGELAGEMVTKTGSGDVEVDRLDGSLVTKSGSGRPHRTPGERPARSSANGASGEHHHRRRAGHRRLARPLHRHRPGQPGARARPAPPTDGPATRRDHRPHRERRPPGAPVMRGDRSSASARAGPATRCRPTPQSSAERTRAPRPPDQPRVGTGPAELSCRRPVEQLLELGEVPLGGRLVVHRGVGHRVAVSRPVVHLVAGGQPGVASASAQRLDRLGRHRAVVVGVAEDELGPGVGQAAVRAVARRR